MQIIRPMLQGKLLVRCTSCHMLLFLATDLCSQNAALSMQEQERAANEEVEKRLKAALTAKREPMTSRVASPGVGTGAGVDSGTIHIPDASTDNASLAQDHTSEDTAMEIDANPSAVSPLSTEVRSHSSMKSKSDAVTGLYHRNRGYLNFSSCLMTSRRSHRAMLLTLLGSSPFCYSHPVDR
jgi:hypothetical protein